MKCLDLCERKPFIDKGFVKDFISNILAYLALLNFQSFLLSGFNKALRRLKRLLVYETNIQNRIKPKLLFNGI